MKRRTLIGAALAASCLSFAKAYHLNLCLEQSCSPGNHPDMVRILCKLVGDPESAAWIGRCYLALPGVHTDVAHLLGDPSLRFLQNALSASSSVLVRFYEQQRATDFHSGDIIVLDNWILARSEVHVCAALAVLREGGVG